MEEKMRKKESVLVAYHVEDYMYVIVKHNKIIEIDGKILSHKDAGPLYRFLTDELEKYNHDKENIFKSHDIVPVGIGIRLMDKITGKLYFVD